eukprot:TRINITY_DN15714_c0_g1_i1.p1 TRINITY_DN15714_c0_g1~~TRINITY_DN15714_c0_g1_i1.p1  ORF type:complete len:349 (+),score=85.79 TRINITY_DN15714_c0_g1_i1:99-1145(+)
MHGSLNFEFGIFSVEATFQAEAAAPTPRRLNLEPGSPSPTRAVSSERGSLSVCQAATSPALRSNVLASPDSREKQIPSTPTTRSSWSRTSIATPETTGGRSQIAPSPEGKADSELELALELVNYVSAEVADQLIDRLRSEEAARKLAEAECLRALELAASLQEEDAQLCCCPAFEVSRDAMRRAVLCWAFLAAMLLGLAAGLWAAQVPLTTFLSAPLQPLALLLEEPEVGEQVWLPVRGVQSIRQEERRHEACRNVEKVCCEDELGMPCEVLLLKASEEANDLRTRQSENQVAFGGVIEAVSEWVSFLHQLTRHPNSSLVDSELDQRCVEAARPGQAALEALMLRQSR